MRNDVYWLPSPQSRAEHSLYITLYNPHKICYQFMEKCWSKSLHHNMKENKIVHFIIKPTHNEICNFTLKKLYGFYASKTQHWLEWSSTHPPKYVEGWIPSWEKITGAINFLLTIQIWPRRDGILQNKHTYPGSAARYALQGRQIVRF